MLNAYWIFMVNVQGSTEIRASSSGYVFVFRGLPRVIHVSTHIPFSRAWRTGWSQKGYL